MIYMKTKKAIVLPKTEQILKQLGEQIRLARLRRDRVFDTCKPIKQYL